MSADGRNGRGPETGKGWFVDVVLGGLAGGVVGAVVAVNVVIFSGTDDGYQASPSAVFDHSPLLGAVVAAIVVGAPVCGIAAMRRHRRRRTEPHSK